MFSKLSSSFGIGQHKEKQPPGLSTILNQKQTDYTVSKPDEQKFEQILEHPTINLSSLQALSWLGVPTIYRAKIWRLLLQYMPSNKLTTSSVILKKREDYQQYLKQYSQQEMDEPDKKIFKIIVNDVIRTQPEMPLFRELQIQKLLERLLYIWNMRHPQSGYVQGINDIAAVVVTVFLAEVIKVDMKTGTQQGLDKIGQEIIDNIEADSYWCLSKIVEYVQDYFTNNHPGVRKALIRIRGVIEKLDPDLEKHFKKEEVDFFQFAFRMVICLLVREFPMHLAVRLMDTYIADPEGLNVLHVYVCAALILKFSKTLQKSKFIDMILLLQNLPTKTWQLGELEDLLQQAHTYRALYDKSQHIKSDI